MEDLVVVEGDGEREVDGKGEKGCHCQRRLAARPMRLLCSMSHVERLSVTICHWVPKNQARTEAHNTIMQEVYCNKLTDVMSRISPQRGYSCASEGGELVHRSHSIA